MEAEAVAIQSWQDPQGDIVLIYSERECSIFFGCWIAPGEPADYVCQLSFQRVAAVRSYPREFLPYRLPVRTGPCIYRIIESDLLREVIAYRQRHYPGRSFDSSQYQHFVIAGHDIYHEILAVRFAEARIAASELVDERLMALQRAT
jgi:hypothetical protein